MDRIGEAPTEEQIQYARRHCFVVESNHIEGIERDPTTRELSCFSHFLNLKKLTVADVQNFVNVYQPDALLRTERGMNVRVGNHVPPSGGSNIRTQLEEILDWANNKGDVCAVHQAYETLHPFMDCNGRSGRAIWAWQTVKVMGELPAIGFLHSWYYQSLSAGEGR